MSPLLAQTSIDRTPSYRRPSRLGWTLVEVLLVVAVAGILSALLFPAVSSSRESARLTSCNNNLHQIGLALTQFHNQHREFPIGCVEWRPPANTTRRQLAWSAFLLPFLGEQKLHNQLNFNTPFDSPENALAASTILPVYICPTSNRRTHEVQGRGPCDYGGIYGERINGASPKPQGMMLLDRAVRAADVRDGLSNTLIVGEDTMWPDGQWINGRNIFDQAYAINTAPSWENDLRSLHPGGANAVLANAAVRWLSNSTDLNILAALCTRAGGEIISSN